MIKAIKMYTIAILVFIAIISCDITNGDDSPINKGEIGNAGELLIKNLPNYDQFSIRIFKNGTSIKNREQFWEATIDQVAYGYFFEEDNKKEPCELIVDDGSYESWTGNGLYLVTIQYFIRKSGYMDVVTLSAIVIFNDGHAIVNYNDFKYKFTYKEYPI